MHLRYLILSVIFSFLAGGLFAQKTIKDFQLINATDKKEVALSSFSGAKAVVVIFTSNYCPYSKLYEDRILSLHKEFKDNGVALLLINPNDPSKSKNDSIEKMAKKAKDKNYQFPYLADKEQNVKRQFGAAKTPEAFVLLKKGSTFQIVYQGAIDDNPQVPQDVSQQYIRDVLKNIIEGKTIANKTVRPTGCIIKNN